MQTPHTDTKPQPRQPIASDNVKNQSYKQSKWPVRQFPHLFTFKSQVSVEISYRSSNFFLDLGTASVPVAELRKKFIRKGCKSAN